MNRIYRKCLSTAHNDNEKLSKSENEAVYITWPEIPCSVKVIAYTICTSVFPYNKEINLYSII